MYFAHKRVSLPLAGWVHAAHAHNTPILGTLIFEWDESKDELGILLEGPTLQHAPLGRHSAVSTMFADRLIALALSQGVEGFLVNVETSLDVRQRGDTLVAQLERLVNAERLRKWVDYLRQEGLRRTRELRGGGGAGPHWHVVWYDSVIYPSGQLGWQDALTPANCAYFQASTACFTNYTWARPPCYRDYADDLHPALALSAAMCDSLQRPRSDVYVGIDVFGRNCYGAHDTWKALEMIKPDRRRIIASHEPVELARRVPAPNIADYGEGLGLSVALFAPGWTWEHESGRTWDEWWREDAAFWVGTNDAPANARPIAAYFPPSPLPLASAGGAAALCTAFTKGSGIDWFVGGSSIWRGKGWTDMGVCTPKPLLAWPHPYWATSDDEEFARRGDAVTTALDERIVWTGNTSLRIRSSSNDTVQVGLLHVLVGEPVSDILYTEMLTRGEAGTPLFKLTRSGVCSTLRCTGMLMREPCGNDWTRTVASFSLPPGCESGTELCFGTTVSAQMRHDIHVGLVYIGTQPLDSDVHDATLSDTGISWDDFAPWAPYYDVFLTSQDSRM